MKASIKIFKNKQTKEGYPVMISFVDGSKRKYKTLLYTELQFWDAANIMITSMHPQYDHYVADLLNAKAKVDKINYGKLTYDEAFLLLFGADKTVSYQFADAVVDYFNDTSSGKLNQTVMNSWSAVFPDVGIDKITPDMANAYMEGLLKKNKANGVHTYMRRLTTLFNRVSKLPNPFSGVRPKKVKTASKHLTDADLKKLFFTRTYVQDSDHVNDNFTKNRFRYYFMLMFYLGGIDAIDLANLRYDKHVVDGRIQFFRHKGGSDVFVNNIIVPEALELLKQFNCYPYLVPLYKNTDYKSAIDKMRNQLNDKTKDLGLSRRVYIKGARYSFIDRAQQLLIDQRITIEIVGHSQQGTHSIYTSEFPLSVRDAAHLKIISL